MNPVIQVGNRVWTIQKENHQGFWRSPHEVTRVDGSWFWVDGEASPGGAFNGNSSVWILAEPDELQMAREYFEAVRELEEAKEAQRAAERALERAQERVASAQAAVYSAKRELFGKGVS